MTGGALYVYCVTEAGGRVPTQLATVESSLHPLATIEHDGLAAVVSEIAEETVRMTRANLEAHHGVVEAMLTRRTVLPMRFGLVVDSAAVLVDNFLRPEHRELTRLLKEYRDRVEMRVEARFLDDVAVNEAVAAVPKARRLQAVIGRLAPAAAYYERLELGELIAGAIDHIKERETARLGEQLASVAHRARPLTAADESVVFRGAFLVDRSALERFDTVLTTMAERERSRMSFSLVGPLAPWDFVELQAAPARGGRRSAARTRSMSPS